MNIVNTAKARAYASAIDDDGDQTAADWIRELADEVESLTTALASAQGLKSLAASKAERATAERDAAVAGLQEVYNMVIAVLREARHVADTHPDPAAAGAALRILGAQ